MQKKYVSNQGTWPSENYKYLKNCNGNFVIICDKILDETKNHFEVISKTNFSFPCIILLFIKSWLMFIITGYYFYRKTKKEANICYSNNRRLKESRRILFGHYSFYQDIKQIN